MLVHEEVALAVGDFAIPDVNAVGIEAETGKMIDVRINGLLDRNAKSTMSPKGVGERRGGGGAAHH